ncbi:C1 family peptidase [Nicoliella spurrieriana]|uniref:Aminopeptidase n=1 Tax=Nicoliella spurrieriana TaxID=2925830 RepID=A0A976RT96_9LACO|nr:C1 family peptidase [Nicoliella spurrieriana]UQS87231.1 C1 family peptidase [Nicoliella spurrieriana]
MTNEVSANDLARFKTEYDRQPQADVIARAIQENGINKVAIDNQAKVRLNPTFSIDLKASKNDKITDQKQAGFCWMFALMNILRHQFVKQNNVSGFELSSNFLFFWDKIERANAYYDQIIRTADQDTHDREVSIYLSYPDEDGGEWDMAVALVQKYGIMPDAAFPRTAVANNTGEFDRLLSLKLRRDGAKLRELVNADANVTEVKATRKQMLTEVYRIVAMSIGVPPKTFDFEYRDDKDNYHIDRNLTPKQFYDKYFGLDLSEYVPVCNFPHRAYNQLYYQPTASNVVGGPDIHYLNLPMPELKRMTLAQLKNGEPVWFGNDVGAQSITKAGLLDSHLYRRDRLFDVNLDLTKKQRFEYQEAQESHAMTFTGVDVIDGKPTKWQVENSWGIKVGEDGYFTMSDDWMDNFVYEVIVKREYLTAKQQKMLTQTPVELEPWD